MIKMNIRRIQKTGTSTMTVSLPKDWINDHGLKAGDAVIIEVLPDGTLTLDPTVEKKEKKLAISILIDNSESEEHLGRKLIGAYLAGYGNIQVKSKSGERIPLELKRTVKEFSNMMIGPEVIEETSDAIVLHDLSDPTELPQRKCVKRMQLIVSSMHSDSMIAFETKDDTLARDVINRDSEVDRLYWMVVKQYDLILTDRKLAERIGIGPYEGLSLMLVARALERIGDHAEKIAKNTLSAIEVGKLTGQDMKIGDLSSSSLKVLEESMNAFFALDVEAANKAIDQGNILVQNCEQLRPKIRASSGMEVVTKTTVLDSIMRTTMLAMDIGEITINGAMRKEVSMR
jgi:phosphate uptake regulator